MKRTSNLNRSTLIINGAGSTIHDDERQRRPPRIESLVCLPPKLKQPAKHRYFRQPIGTHSLFDFILEQTRSRRRYDAVIIVDRVQERTQQQNQGQAGQNRRGEGTSQGAQARPEKGESEFVFSFRSDEN